MTNQTIPTPDMTEAEARAWALDRYGGEAETRLQVQDHPRSIGDQVATLTVRLPDGRCFIGHGFSSLTPFENTVWAKAARDLQRQEACARPAMRQG